MFVLCVVGVLVRTHYPTKTGMLELVAKCSVKGERFVEENHWMSSLIKNKTNISMLEIRGEALMQKIFFCVEGTRTRGTTKVVLYTEV